MTVGLDSAQGARRNVFDVAAAAAIEAPAGSGGSDSIFDVPGGGARARSSVEGLSSRLGRLRVSTVSWSGLVVIALAAVFGVALARGHGHDLLKQGAHAREGVGRSSADQLDRAGEHPQATLHGAGPVLRGRAKRRHHSSADRPRHRTERRRRRRASALS
jgi:hypothetical protein